ncbi:MAG: replication protein P [Oleispira sp.]
MNNETFAAELIKQFAGIWPSLRATMKPDDIFEYQVQMIKALTENRLNTLECVQQGFRKARTEGGQYLPSVPEFVRWCKPERKEQCHNLLPRLEKTESTAEQRAEFKASLDAVMKGIK